MDRLGIIGAAWRRITTRGLERFLVPPEEQAERLPRLRRILGAHELVYLSTCNRVEILFARHFREDGQPPLEELRRRAFEELVGRAPEPGEAERELRVWAGEGALEHLLMVAGGLDSAQLGEREIRGQLRQAHQQSTELGLTGPILDWTVERAMQLARRLERETELSTGRTSLAGIGLDALERHLEARPGTVALVGVSSMTERCGEWLRAQGLPCLVVNRGEEAGRALARRLDADFVRLETFRRRPAALSAVVTATGAREPIFGVAEIEGWIEAAGEPPLVVDFSVPSDVDPEAASVLGVEHLDMETISRRAEENRGRRQADLAAARERVDQALLDLRRESGERALSPVMKAISGRYRETAEEGVAKLFRRQLRHLGEEDRRVLEGFARGLAKRFAHVPVVGLRALAGEHGLDVVDTFLAASDRELGWGLRRAAEEEARR